MALVGSEWVLWLLVLISVFSITLILERFFFYKQATRDLAAFRAEVREAARAGKWEQALKASETRAKSSAMIGDFESELSQILIENRKAGETTLHEMATDSILRKRQAWEKNLAILATIGNNAPFVGLFGTVLGIIQAFHHLSQQADSGVTTSVTAGISDALIATAVGILVAIPAVVAFNLYQKRVRSAIAEAEALKSYLIGRMGGS